jgi:hypothetical protein
MQTMEPSRYLEKIQLKFPKIEILKSEFYDEKSNSIMKIIKI